MRRLALRRRPCRQSSLWQAFNVRRVDRISASGHCREPLRWRAADAFDWPRSNVISPIQKDRSIDDQIALCRIFGKRGGKYLTVRNLLLPELRSSLQKARLALEVLRH